MINQAQSSPCISLCQLDEEAVCKGCYRTAEEIRDWIYMGTERRQEVLTLCADRAASRDSG